MSRLTSLVRRLGHQPWFAAFGRRVVPLDRFVMSHGPARWSTGRMFGLPTLLLTTTGRRTGQRRSQPLLYVTDGAALVVVGSNWGQAHQPAWSANLLAEPDATVTLDGAEIAVRATLVAGAERERLWERLRAEWPAYRTYERRAAGREIRMFRLERRTAPPQA
jgi:deazaflavin-dependent oxidoreductase (nitroreductase family)